MTDTNKNHTSYDSLSVEDLMRVIPYKYKGALDLENDKIVCAPRIKEISRVMDGIRKGDYWAILAPRQMGKSTFLYQLQHALTDYICVHIDLQICPKKEEGFYKYLAKTIISKTANTLSLNFPTDWDPEEAWFSFSKFVKNIRSNKKIVFLFDEIGGIPDVESFLKLWRNLFNSRLQDKILKNISVVITGADDLSRQTLGRTSPFNISEKLYLNELTLEEAEAIVDTPISRMNVKLESVVKSELISLVSGHPQLLQNLCALLVRNALRKEPRSTNIKIVMSDLDTAIEQLFTISDNINQLETQLSDSIFTKLAVALIKREKIAYLKYRKYSFSGIGPIIKDTEGNCAIRNRLYEKYLADVLDTEIKNTESNNKSTLSQSQNDALLRHTDKELEFETVVYCSSEPGAVNSMDEETAFLKHLFCQSTEITIKNEKGQWMEIDFSPREKLMYCYLAYKNYKALQHTDTGKKHWREIPLSHEYRVSSNHSNNAVQKPEWEVFRKALERYDVEFIGDSIKTWIYTIRRKLVKEGVGNPIYSGKGRGDGYILKGTVTFVKE